MTSPLPLDDEPTPVVEGQPSVPYPGFCSHEAACAGAAYCPRDPTCID